MPDTAAAPIDVAGMRRAAEAASRAVAPGPWEADEYEVYALADCDLHPVASCEVTWSCRQPDQQNDLAAHIAAWCPASALAVLDKLDAAEAATQAARAEVAEMVEALGFDTEHDAILNLEGALIDLDRLNADKVCRQTIRRVQQQLAAVHRLVARHDERKEAGDA